ncbi:MAG: HD domain-containing protein [Pseudomonadota bacterium]
MSDRIASQVAFLEEIDRLKTVLRASHLHDGSRRENSAEHSWHVALFALVLAEHASDEVDPLRVLKMLLLHDIVEIDAGDMPIHGGGDPAKKARLEKAAADRIFALLPADQAADFRALWDEYEDGDTADARFARAMDRFQPPLSNLANGGGTWAEYNVTYPQMEARVAPAIRKGTPALWAWLGPQLERYFGAA